MIIDEEGRVTFSDLPEELVEVIESLRGDSDGELERHKDKGRNTEG